MVINMTKIKYLEKSITEYTCLDFSAAECYKWGWGDGSVGTSAGSSSIYNPNTSIRRWQEGTGSSLEAQGLTSLEHAVEKQETASK